MREYGIIIGCSVAGAVHVVLEDLLTTDLDGQVVLSGALVGLNQDLSSVGID